jgi:hypothetical protein
MQNMGVLNELLLHALQSGILKLWQHCLQIKSNTLVSHAENNAHFA